MHVRECGSCGNISQPDEDHVGPGRSVLSCPGCGRRFGYVEWLLDSAGSVAHD